MTSKVQEGNEKRHIRGVGDAVRSTVDGMWRIYKRLPVDGEGKPLATKPGKGGVYQWFTLSSEKKLKDAIESAKTAFQAT